VEEARTALGVRSPQSWQLTADRLTGSLTLGWAWRGRAATQDPWWRTARARSYAVARCGA